jgi:hypothetical protein
MRRIGVREGGGVRLRVLHWACEEGLSVVTWGRPWLLAMPRSASSSVNGGGDPCTAPGGLTAL